MRNFAVLLVVSFLVASCASGPVEQFDNPTLAPPTLARAPGLTPAPPTVPPAPTLVLPVSYQTPVPAASAPINVQNVSELKQIAHYSGETNFSAALTKDRSLLFIGDALGIDIFDYQTKERIRHIDTGVRELQVSRSGEWALVDQGTLIHLVPGAEPELLNLREVTGIDYGQASLSPDGSKVALSEGYCSENCPGIFQILSLPDRQVLYSWENGTYKGMHGADPTFSADGSIVVTRVDNNIIFWRTADASEAARIQNIQGRSRFVLSEDASAIAIGQINTVQVWDVPTGKSIQTISSLWAHCMTRLSRSF